MEQETHLSQVGLAYDSSRILRLPFPALGGHLWGQLLEAIGGQCLIGRDGPTSCVDAVAGNTRSGVVDQGAFKRYGNAELHRAAILMHQGSILGAFLDLIHRLIGMLAEHLDGRSMLRVERDTDTNGNSCFATRRQGDWSADLRDEQAGLFERLLFVADVLQQGHVLIASHPGERVGGTDATQETAGHGL